MQRYTKFSNFPNVFVYFSLRSQLSTLNCQLSIVNWQLSIKNCHRPSRASDSTNLYKPNSSCEPSYSSRTSELYSSIININTLKDIVVPHGDNASPWTCLSLATMLSQCPWKKITTWMYSHDEGICTPRLDFSHQYIRKPSPRMGTPYLLYREIRRGALLTHVDVFVASLLYLGSNLRDLTSQAADVFRTSFRGWPYNWLLHLFHQWFFQPRPHKGLVFGAKISIIFQTAKYLRRKMHIGAVFVSGSGCSRATAGWDIPRTLYDQPANNAPVPRPRIGVCS